MEKENLRPLYSELQGYLSQAPGIPENPNVYIYDKSVWEQYNNCVSLVSQTSGKDYNRFCVNPQRLPSGNEALPLITYRQKLGGLITNLHGEYFANEPAPFSGGPNTVISQSQQQNQSFYVQMLLDIQSKVDEKLPSYREGSKERSFLQRFKSSLGSVSNVVQLLSLFINLAKEFGLSINEILKIIT
ncbi:MAG: hypothetical protein JSV30_04855 [Candidatus Omnitrophota bacterium]|nr:MAG: hypothetical protein JSV30_04855 [Candidatus Omnitrophota bacterium]